MTKEMIRSEFSEVVDLLKFDLEEVKKEVKANSGIATKAEQRVDGLMTRFTSMEMQLGQTKDQLAKNGELIAKNASAITFEVNGVTVRADAAVKSSKDAETYATKAYELAQHLENQHLELLSESVETALMRAEAADQKADNACRKAEIAAQTIVQVQNQVGKNPLNKASKETTSPRGAGDSSFINQQLLDKLNQKMLATEKQLKELSSNQEVYEQRAISAVEKADAAYRKSEEACTLAHEGKAHALNTSEKMVDAFRDERAKEPKETDLSGHVTKDDFHNHLTNQLSGHVTKDDLQNHLANQLSGHVTKDDLQNHL